MSVALASTAGRAGPQEMSYTMTEVEGVLGEHSFTLLLGKRQAVGCHSHSPARPHLREHLPMDEVGPVEVQL